jgi:hypothetical protein
MTPCVTATGDARGPSQTAGAGPAIRPVRSEPAASRNRALGRQGECLGVAVTRTGKAAEAEVAYIDAGETLRQAGHLMRELGVGVLEVRGENGKTQGTISRDMVVRRIAAGGDPGTVTVGEVAYRRRPALLAPGRGRRLWPRPRGPAMRREHDRKAAAARG